MNRLFLASLLATAAFAADPDFNGRWNIHVQAPRGRVWWLEVRNAGSGPIQGSFVGFPGGQVDPIADARIEDGELRFSCVRGDLKQSFRATFQNGRLTGQRDAGGGTPALPWTAVRAPELPERDGANIRPKRNLSLFDGKSTEGWRQIVPEAPGWYVEDGLLKNRTKASDIASIQKFWNFEARVEYRYAKGSNSGIGLRGRYEVQIYDNYGAPPDVHGNGALYSRIPPSVNASKAPGEWQVLNIRLIGRELTVTLNGTVIINHKQIDGPTAITTDPNEDKPGPLVLQGDHGPVEFRSIEVTELSGR